MKRILTFLAFLILAAPDALRADFITAGDAGAIIVTDNGQVFAPGRPAGYGVTTRAHSSPVVIKDGSATVAPRVKKIIPARSFPPNFTGVNSLLGTPGPGSGSLLGTPGPGAGTIEGRRHRGRHHGSRR